MEHEQAHHVSSEPPILPEDVPVPMPMIPARLTIDTMQQLKAMSDATRVRIIAIIQHQPMTAKQIADRLDIAPGTIGHHMQVLEAAGLAQIVARRQVRGTVAKYYTRTARIFDYDPPPEVAGPFAVTQSFVKDAHNELQDLAAQSKEPTPLDCGGFPHARLAPARAEAFAQRLRAVMDDFIREPSDPDGVVVSMLTAIFVSPDYMQVGAIPPPTATSSEEE